MGDPAVNIRRYRATTDRDAVIAVMEEALSATNARFHDPPPAGDPTVVFNPRNTPDAAFLVAADRTTDMIVGTGAFRPLAPENIPDIAVDSVAELKRMHVRPAYQRQGIGRRLLARLRDQARTFGYTTFLLQTTEYQHAAIAFYRDEGFEQVDCEVLQIDGSPVELLTFCGPV